MEESQRQPLEKKKKKEEGRRKRKRKDDTEEKKNGGFDVGVIVGNRLIRAVKKVC